MKTIFTNNITLFSSSYILVSGIVFAVLFLILYKLFEFLGKDPKNILPLNFAKKIRWPLLIFIISLYTHTQHWEFIAPSARQFIMKLATILIIGSVTWMIIILLRIIKQQLLLKYNINEADNLKARKIQTQYILLENTVIFIIIVIAIGITLMSFSAIRAIGISVLTSAGIAGIIIGFAAQKALGTLLAGIQIAITQPIRIDDVVIIEGEWGRIEEITLTYVVIKIWDKRRLIVPSTYFIENTFQNWTRTRADILGTVFIYTDYTVPMEALREEMTRLLKLSPLWDGEVNVLQVTNATEKAMEIRALMSARDAAQAFDLRVYIREYLIKFIAENYSEALPRFRVEKKPEET